MYLLKSNSICQLNNVIRYNILCMYDINLLHYPKNLYLQLCNLMHMYRNLLAI